MARWLTLTLTLALIVGAWQVVARAGLDGESNTDGYNLAPDPDEQAEARRQAIIARQIDLVARMNAINCLLDPFEPWPAVPGDIWGYPQNERVRQPIGHESGQVGPDRWIYRPLYAEDVEGGPAVPEPVAPPRPSVSAGPELPAPSDVQQGGLRPAPATKSLRRVPRGPRSF